MEEAYTTTLEFAKQNPRRIKALFTIVDRGLGKKVTELCQSMGVTYNLCFMGKGTANSDILNCLGLGETKKDVILSVVLEEKLPDVFNAFQKQLKLDKPGGGIAFAIPIMSVGGPITLQYISGLFQELPGIDGSLLK